MTITRSDSRSPAAGGNFSRNKSGPKYTSSSRRKSHLSPARSNRGASLPSSLSVCWYDSRESLSISVSSVLFFVELESSSDMTASPLPECLGAYRLQQVGREIHAGESQSRPLPSVEILDDLQRLFVVMTVNSVVPMLPTTSFALDGHHSARKLPSVICQ